MDPTSKKTILSVVIPVRNGAAYLRKCLKWLYESSFQDFETIVIDDASTDESPDVALSKGCRLVKFEKQSGPAMARNHGAEIARGEFVLFLDSDVCVLPNTLQQIVNSLQANPDIHGVFGSYDTDPQTFNIISQYRNLLHHFVHQDAKQEASTFWAGCGAVRRDTFLKLGGFDTSFARPSIEDIEMGARWTRSGFRILLDKNIQAKHLKYWPLIGMIKTDIRDRGIPWTMLLLDQREMPDNLNLRKTQRLSVVLAFALLGVFLWGTWYYPWTAAVPVVGFLLMLAVDRWSLTQRVPTLIRGLTVLLIAVLSAALCFLCSPMWLLVMLALLLGIIMLNRPLLAFFVKAKGDSFAALVVPLQLLYFLYCGFSFGMGLFFHWRRGKDRPHSLNTLNAEKVPHVASPDQ